MNLSDIGSAWLRFYEELNDYLTEKKQKTWFEYRFSGSPTIGEVLHDSGVPASDVDLVLVNGRSMGFSDVIRDGDHISFYPVFEILNITGTTRLRDKPLRDPRFICDAHLGRLARYLRMLGFDTAYSNRISPEEIIEVSKREGRIILSKNIRLTRGEMISRAFWVRSDDPLEQLRELVNKLDLSSLFDTLTRCLECNHKISPIEKSNIIDRLQPNTAKYYEEFYLCPSCNKIYWKGSHYEHMMEFIEREIPG
jgi:uncharacterized protein with PIN domain